MKRYLIAGNWKMNTDYKSAHRLVTEIKELLTMTSNLVQILVCPPFTSLPEVAKNIQNTPIKLGAQNCYHEEWGAYTGEISIEMLKSIGCDYVIIGHSERRAIFGETDDLINRKLIACIAKGIIPVLCIGETLQERETGKTFDVLERQLEIGLSGIEATSLSNIVIAYEPVWAIGTGVAASIAQVDEAHNWLRSYLINKYENIGNNVLILYGGSVNVSNSIDILSLTNVNGALIGGASLKADSFVNIYNIAVMVSEKR